MKRLFLLALGALGFGASQASAAVTADPVTGVLSGTIDTAIYSSGIPIVIGFIGFTLAVVAVISLLKKARS